MYKLFVNNYRSFVDQEIQFSKINILIGENSSGKSSLLKFLLAIKQSFDSPLESNFKFFGEYADLGNYSESVYYKKIRSQIGFGFSFDNRYMDFFVNFFIRPTETENEVQENEDDDIFAHKDEILKYVGVAYDYPTNMNFKLSSKLNDHSTIKTYIQNDGIGRVDIIQKKGEVGFDASRRCDLTFDLGDIKGTFTDVVIYKDAFCSIVSADILKFCNKDYKKRGKEIFYKIAFLLVSQNFLRKQFVTLSYVNPMNANPKRFYFKEDKKGTFRTNDIDKFINILGNAKGKKNDKRLQSLNAMISNSGLAQEVRLVENKQLPVVALQVKINDLWSDITDVGYGVSVQLPILFHALFSEMTSEPQTIIIEQPEVHLHPALQAKFIETLVSIGTKNSYFIETHSEHIVRELQVLIKNKKINASDISIHYFKRGKDKFDITRHEIDQNGFMNPMFPDGFYDVSYNLVKELM